MIRPRRPRSWQPQHAVAVALVVLFVSGCWSSAAQEGDRSGDAAEADLDVPPDVVDVTLEDVIGDRDADAAGEGALEQGEDAEDDARDGDDVWPPLPPGCLEWNVFPEGSVGCTPSVPRCPAPFSHCCDTSRCGSLEFGARGCCSSSDCGDPGAFHCVEAIGDSLVQVCTRPEPEFRCPSDLPFCCFNFLGAAVCADHALFGWTSCENQWATGGTP